MFEKGDSLNRQKINGFQHLLPQNLNLNDTHRGNLFSLSSVQEFVEIERWLRLTFLTCLHNVYTNSIHSIGTD